MCADEKDKKDMVVGIGSALVDILAHTDGEFVSSSGAVLGGMSLVEHHIIEGLMPSLPTGHRVVPGGSACNTTIGVGKLGGSARFVGKCGNDEFGRLFRASLEKHAVEPALLQSELPTGRVLSLITPDAQRSMLTFLGASAQTLPEEITLEYFSHAAIVHVEGYLVFNRALIEKALSLARDAGAKVSLDLASHTVVNECRDLLNGLVRDYVDILLANEDEAEAFTGTKREDEALARLCEDAEVGVLKLGPRGSLVGASGQVIRIEPQGGGDAVDSTGAGDLYAAGFLYGLARGMDLAACGELGSACGYEVCQVVGATIPDEGWERIKKLMVAW